MVKKLGMRRAPPLAIAVLSLVVALAQVAVSNDKTPVPADKSQVNAWFQSNVQAFTARKGTLDPNLEAAEARSKVIRVRQDGGGDFKTVTAAIDSIPAGNSERVIISIAGGEYKEKIKIDRTKPFVTLYGSPKDMPTLTYGGTARQYGTVDSASLIVESDYFVAANLVIANSAPRPDGKTPGAQAVALRISGDKSAFYNCRLLGFQDTLCDDRGFHFFKDCYIEGTVDFIFGSGTSLYLSTELRVLGDNDLTIITAQARESSTEDTGYSFVHCSITGTGNGTFLGRAWKASPRVIFSYTDMSSVVAPIGWSDNFHPERDRTVMFGEYRCSGPGSNPAGRAKFAKQLSDAEVQNYISLSYIVGSKWLLPPPNV
ncbi:pectinesterase PPME1-like [Syzygium oleosum]|uniref:pectinesterase PPME1-like n=1 Tax=Syzygium oleosum TaxID=219896 RepID=UPI0024BB4501|nr:pectinesterase PPME1-like [Syzygium oleosum]